jgi:hypothetical protein
MDPDRQFREAVRQIVEYSDNYGQDKGDRIWRSAVVMRYLPRQAEDRGGVAGAADPVALSAENLMRGSFSLEEWVSRVLAVRPS